MRDLLQAYQFSDEALRKVGSTLLFGGVTDQNYDYTKKYTGFPTGDEKDYKNSILNIMTMAWAWI